MKPTAASVALKDAVQSARQVRPIAFAIDLGEDRIRLGLSVAEVADLLGWKAQWVREAISRGELAARSTGRRYVVPVSCLLEYLDGADFQEEAS